MAAPTKIFCILAKLQSGAGVDATPTAANAVRTLNVPSLKVEYLEEGDRKDEQHAGFGDLGSVGSFGRHVKLPIQIALKGGGADYSVAANRPEADPFLQAAGFTVTTSGGVGAGKLVYQTADASDTFPFLTLYAYSQYKLFKLIDCVVLPKFTFENMKKGILDMTVIGRLVSDPTDASLPGGLTYNATVPPVFAGSTNAIGAFNQGNGLLTRQASIDCGTQYAPQTGGGASDGLAGFLITGRDAKHSATIQSVALSSFAIHALAKQVTGATDTSGQYVIGAAGVFNRVTIRFGQWAFKPSQGDASGIGTTVLDGPIAARSIASGDGVGRELAVVFD